uniref:Uncharacterized protein n=1 Tax=Setaria viridis TaxID=4556 RepID=A0A4U6T5J6_SETVI|nr:hypothetical protein SEVIR_9G398500v2 [Setaria viridis]
MAETLIGWELPYDLIADVLRRAAWPCPGASAGRDATSSTRADLLPRSVGGLFLNYRAHCFPEFLSSPTTGPSISGDLEDYDGSLYLGISQKGVYFAFNHDWHRVWILLLNGSCGQMDINYYKYPCGNDKHKEVVEDRFNWSSDDDSVLNTEHMVEGHYDGYTSFLGFHPYKEIVFLTAALSRAVAYHWNTSRFQDLGNIFPKNYRDIAGQCVDIERSFPYTPCWMEFPEIKLQV